MADLVSGFSNWLWSVVLYLLATISNLFIDTINNIIAGLASLATSAADLLPDYTVPSPGQLVDQSGFLSALNWLIPVTFFVDCLLMMTVAYATYHLVGPVLRWLKILR